VLLVGIDWADKEHVYCLMDDAGTTLSTGTIEHTAEGLEQFMTAVRARVQTPHDVLVALETSHGPLVGTLLDQGFTVYAINPKAVERHRDRFRVAGAKSDLRDAWVLAALLRTDRTLYRPLTPDSEVAQELRTLTRDRADSDHARESTDRVLEGLLSGILDAISGSRPARGVGAAAGVSNARAFAGRITRGIGGFPAASSLSALSEAGCSHPQAYASARLSHCAAHRPS
jgi:transposase